MSNMNQIDRQRGTLLGLAVGDALGAAVEFQYPGTFEPVTGYRGGGPHSLAPGEWTDDTSMALALADSVAEVGWDLNDQTERYVRWWKEGQYSVNGRCFDIGNATISALRRFQKTGDARTSGDPSEHAAGNGSIMRLAPVPIRYIGLFPDRMNELVERAIEFADGRRGVTITGHAASSSPRTSRGKVKNRFRAGVARAQGPHSAQDRPGRFPMRAGPFEAQGPMRCCAIARKNGTRAAIASRIT